MITCFFSDYFLYVLTSIVKFYKRDGRQWKITREFSASEMSQWINVFAISPEDLSTLPEHMWWKQITNTCKLSSDFCMCTHVNK